MTNHHVRTHTKKETTMPGPLSNAHTVTKLPAQDLERARAFYRDKLGLEPVEERTGGLRYVCGPTEFHLFSSAGAPSGASTQMAFEVENLEATLADLRARGVTFERFEMSGFDVRGETHDGWESSHVCSGGMERSRWVSRSSGGVPCCRVQTSPGPSGVRCPDEAK